MFFLYIKKISVKKLKCRDNTIKKLQDNILFVGILLLVLAIIVISRKYRNEHFSTDVIETEVDINHPEFDARDQARIVSGEDVGEESGSSNNINYENTQIILFNIWT